MKAGRSLFPLSTMPSLPIFPLNRIQKMTDSSTQATSNSSVSMLRKLLNSSISSYVSKRKSTSTKKKPKPTTPCITHPKILTRNNAKASNTKNNSHSRPFPKSKHIPNPNTSKKGPRHLPISSLIKNAPKISPLKNSSHSSSMTNKEKSPALSTISLPWPPSLNTPSKRNPPSVKNSKRPGNGSRKPLWSGKISKKTNYKISGSSKSASL